MLRSGERRMSRTYHVLFLALPLAGIDEMTLANRPREIGRTDDSGQPLA